ncbi:hypothetical protein ACQKLX_16840 [Bosea sp. NPDC003192]
MKPIAQDRNLTAAALLFGLALAGNPLFKIEVDSDNGKPVFRAKTAGTET